ncbi:hypothetical protein ABK040_001231 [Willaertia magna]
MNKSDRRLIIQNLVLNNFKSYAGKREIGPFHKSFTCIVGPNGSGKSNVIDAIQFVFGKRGKKLRLKKLSELIHCSTNFPNLEEASVSVHFAEIWIKNHEEEQTDSMETTNNNDLTDDIVPNSEFVIKRNVTKSGNSTYFIDDNKSSFTEVTNLLKSKGIDLENNRFLILQGEVEQISLMKPKAPTEHEDGLLEYIEDIIGTDKYVKPIEEAFVKVEELNDKRTEKLNRLKSSEKEKESLEGPMNEAMAYLKKRRDLVENQHVLVQRMVMDTDIKLSKKRADHTQMKQQFEEEKSKLQQILQEISKKEDAFKEEKREQEKLNKKLAKLKSKFAALENRDEKLKEDTKNTKTRKQQLEKSLENIKSKIEALEKKIESCEKDEKKAKEEIEKITPELESSERTAEKIYQEHQKDIKKLCKEKELKQKELVPYKQKENEIKEKISIAQSEINLIKEKKDSKKNDMEKVKVNLEETQKKLEEKKEELTKRKKNQTQVLTKLKDEKEGLDKLIKNSTELEKKVITLKQKYASLKNDQQTNMSQNKLINALLNESNIPGVCGRLGDLGHIDSKYDIAISTACGVLNCVVVETTESAKKCVEYLKQHNLGIATFIMLDKMKPAPTTTLTETPEKVPRLFDLIHANEEKYRSAFFYGLQNTLVANDLDQATKIAYNKQKRWRVVSLKGDLIEDYGTMSGGGKAVMKGLMTLTGGKKTSRVTEKDVKQVKVELDEADSEFNTMQNTRSSVTQFIKKLETEHSNITMEVKEITIEIESLENTVNDLEKQVKKLEKELKQQPTNKKEFENRLKELNDEIEEYNQEMTEHKKQYKTIEVAIEQLKEQIDNIGGGKLKTQKAIVERLNNQLEEVNTKLNKAQVQKESSEKSLKKLQKQFKSEEDEFKKIDSQLEALVKQRNELDEEAKPILEELSTAEEKLKEKESQLQSKEAEYENSKKEVNKMREKEVELKNALEDCEKEMKELEKQVTKRSKQLEEYEKNYDQEFEVLFTHEKKKEENEVKEEEQEEEDKMDTSDDTESKSLSKRLKRLSHEELKKINPQQVNYDITILESELEKMKPNLSAIDDYKKKEQEYLNRYKELEEVTIERNKTQKLYEELRRKRLDEFMRGFSTITMKLKEIYQMITLGGDAELELVDSLDPFSEGIVFSVRPPRKSWKNISNLSGGEKTLSSLALVFALHHYKPTPIYVMDEIDAALDFRNVSIVANYIKERTKNDAQFLIISLRNNMFEMANILVGIYKTNDVTKSVTINPHAITIPTPTL